MTEEWSSTNQRTSEPMPPTPGHSTPHRDLPGEASRVPGVDGASPDAFEADDESGAANVASGVTPGSSSGDVQGVPVPSDVPADGTSESADPVDGVRVTAIAQKGLADGETDVRMPRTTTF